MSKAAIGRTSETNTTRSGLAEPTSIANDSSASNRLVIGGRDGSTGLPNQNGDSSHHQSETDRYIRELANTPSPNGRLGIPFSHDRPSSRISARCSRRSSLEGTVTLLGGKKRA